jgi:predicted DNA-binding transcriptional regulator AlpA
MVSAREQARSCVVEVITRMIELSNENALNERRSARYLGVSEGVLRLWRSQGKGPRHFKAGEKLVRYRRADLDSWIEARLSAPVALESR